MADAKKCDRCGKFYQEMVSPKLTVRQYVSMRGSHVDYDLCPKCTEKLYAFMKIERDPSKKINSESTYIEEHDKLMSLAMAELTIGTMKPETIKLISVDSEEKNG